MNEIIAWVVGLIAAVAPGFGVAPEPQYNGYVEANYVYVAATNPGRITKIDAVEGDSVEAGQQLFWLNAEQYEAALGSALAQQAAAEATWRNLETGSREQETDVIRASLSQSEASLSLAETTLERSLKLQVRGLVPDAQVDANRSQVETAQAAVEQLKAQLAVAELPARSEQLAAAKANYDAARANVEAARVQLAERTVEAPMAGRVERVYFKNGEVAATGTPVVSILPPGDMKVIFYVPEAARSAFSIGEMLDLTCDGCAEGIHATITFMASDPQNTPPIIYSREERGRLVFMAEAAIEDGDRLLPGQPITLTVPK